MDWKKIPGINDPNFAAPAGGEALKINTDGQEQTVVPVVERPSYTIKYAFDLASIDETLRDVVGAEIGCTEVSVENGQMTIRHSGVRFVHGEPAPHSSASA